MNKNITLKVKKESYDCDDCGYNEEVCCFLYSNMKQFANIKFDQPIVALWKVHI